MPLEIFRFKITRQSQETEAQYYARLIKAAELIAVSKASEEQVVIDSDAPWATMGNRRLVIEMTGETYTVWVYKSLAEAMRCAFADCMPSWRNIALLPGLPVTVSSETAAGKVRQDMTIWQTEADAQQIAKWAPSFWELLAQCDTADFGEARKRLNGWAEARQPL